MFPKIDYPTGSIEVHPYPDLVKEGAMWQWFLDTPRFGQMPAVLFGEFRGIKDVGLHISDAFRVSYGPTKKGALGRGGEPKKRRSQS